MGGWVSGSLWREAKPAIVPAILAANLATLALVFPTASAHAQGHGLVAPQSATGSATAPAPGTGSPGATIITPNPQTQPIAPPAVPPVAQAAPAVPAGQVVLAVAARYSQNSAPINAGLIWRVYAPRADSPAISGSSKKNAPPRQHSRYRRATTSCMQALALPVPPRQSSCVRTRCAKSSISRPAAFGSKVG